MIYFSYNIFRKKEIAGQRWLYTFDLSTREAEASGVQSQPDLQSGFQDSQGNVERPCLRNNKRFIGNQA